MSEKKQLMLWSLAWSIFIETVLFMLLGFVDVFILSKYDDLAASAVGTANQAVSITTIIFTVVSSASAVLISQYLGARLAFYYSVRLPKKSHFAIRTTELCGIALILSLFYCTILS